ncbi:phosphoribosyl-ATP pyrophosphohydrolase [Paenactinomyces guangxiensis]|uniref:Nucleoside triphosphate pyrophosphohydrolase n=1 Tax=Paenactinomyces guangxiensis TaxID=1490290 RepID=A0A7W1WPW5_9BACL|nr:nucleoside triphosphate pyrophosphohydrolase [Paenactinomyces guangxiensis]MBA4493885.1 nucleoside triphosphate pyrophosphohydrolase [Paenactinomyces guangxiensis]MBH8591351.1 nucleoside triphosphate pyrophosphohydrolase [Paenactinomyces guangxiensis]
MPVYNKLIRDKIPEVIAASGKKAVVRALSNEEYIVEARKKLYEELAEYKAVTNDEEALAELADIMELVYALAAVHGSSTDQLEQIRHEKAKKHGEFAKKLFLKEVTD